MIPINKVYFETYTDACISARAQADYYPTGRFIVRKIHSDRYKVVWDECKVRDGVDESDHLSEYWTHCGSGTVSWKTAVENATIEEANW